MQEFFKTTAESLVFFNAEDALDLLQSTARLVGAMEIRSEADLARVKALIDEGSDTHNYIVAVYRLPSLIVLTGEEEQAELRKDNLGDHHQ